MKGRLNVTHRVKTTAKMSRTAKAYTESFRNLGDDELRSVSGGSDSNEYAALSLVHEGAIRTK